LSRVGVTLEGFWIIGFIDHLKIVTTNNYNTIVNFHSLQIIIAHVKSTPACTAFTRHFLITASNNSYSSSSMLKPSLNGGSLPTELFLFQLSSL
jgi:hypothetical protein